MNEQTGKLNKKEYQFHNPTMGRLSFPQLVEEIFNYMTEEPDQTYEIVVGCDSSSGGGSLAFPVAVVVLRCGYGGRFFLQKIKYPASESKRFEDWHQRILQEVVLSCDLALKLKEALEQKDRQVETEVDYQFQYIHADVGQKGITRDMIKEVTGLIRSNGFVPKIKPESFAASIVADRFT